MIKVTPPPFTVKTHHDGAHRYVLELGPGESASVSIHSSAASPDVRNYTAPDMGSAVWNSATSTILRITAPARATNGGIWNSSYSVAFNDGGSVVVLPKIAPTCKDYEYTFLEDEVGMFYLTRFGSSSTFDHLIVEVVDLPIAGTLHQSDPVHRSMANAMNRSGDLVNYEGTAYFVPASDGVGFPYSNFTYRFRDSSGLHSAVCVLTLNYKALNDLPQISDGVPTTVKEDSGDRVLLSLATFDVEDDSLGVLITSLPSKGRLFQTSDGTVTGNLTHIDRPYAVFDIGRVTSQFVSEVNAVSSFWGGPPYAGYHALQVFVDYECAQLHIASDRSVVVNLVNCAVLGASAPLLSFDSVANIFIAHPTSS